MLALQLYKAFADHLILFVVYSNNNNNNNNNNADNDAADRSFECNFQWRWYSLYPFIVWWN